MRAIRLLFLRRLRLQPLRALLAVLAVGAGVSLALAVVVSTQSFTRSMHQVNQGLAGRAPIRVVGAMSRAGLDASALPAIQHTEGVDVAVPMVQAVSSAFGTARSERVIILGVDCSVQALVGPIGCDPAALASVSDSTAPLAGPSLLRRLGPEAVLRTDASLLPLAGSTQVPQLDRLNGGRVLVMAMPESQRLLGRVNRYDVVYVLPKPGTDVAALRTRLQASVGPQNGVLRGTDPAPVTGVVTAALVPLLSMMAIVALGIGAVLIYNVIALSLAERRRAQAVVAALGARPRLLLLGALTEAGLLGLIGGVSGAAGGLLLAGPVTSSMGSFVDQLAGIQVRVHAGMGTFVTGAVLGVVVGVAAAWLPARRALRVDVAAELSGRDLAAEAAPELHLRRAAILTGVGLASIGLCWLSQRNGAIEAWQGSAAMIGVLGAMIGLVLAVGALAAPVLKVAGARLERSAATTRLGLANLVREPGRTGVMAVAIAAGVGIAVTTASFNRSITVAVTHSVERNLAGKFIVASGPTGNNINLESRMPPATLAQLRAIPGVARVSSGQTVLTGHDAGGLIGVTTFDDIDLKRVPIVLGSRDPARFASGQAIIGGALARRQHLRPGSLVHLATPTGMVQVPVMAIEDNGDFGGSVVTVPTDLFVRYWGQQPTAGVSVTPVPGLSPEALARRVRSVYLPMAYVQTPAELVASNSKGIARQLTPFWTLQRGLLLVSFIAVLSTLLLVGYQRRRELALLAAIGMTPRELRRMVLSESVAVGLVGMVLGTIFGVLGFEAMREAGPVIIGYHDPFRIDLWSPFVYGFIGIVVVLLAGAWPARSAARLPILDALRYE